MVRARASDCESMMAVTRRGAGGAGDDPCISRDQRPTPDNITDNNLHELYVPVHTRACCASRLAAQAGSAPERARRPCMISEARSSMWRTLSLPARRSASETGVLPQTSAASTCAPLLSSSCTACRPQRGVSPATRRRRLVRRCVKVRRCVHRGSRVVHSAVGMRHRPGRRRVTLSTTHFVRSGNHEPTNQGREARHRRGEAGGHAAARLVTARKLNTGAAPLVNRRGVRAAPGRMRTGPPRSPRLQCNQTGIC